MRARELINFDGTPGKYNSITDVDDVEVGHSTIINGNGKLIVGKGPVRTGVTVIFPRGKSNAHLPVFAAYDVLNGNGEMTGTIWVEESGFLETPIAITNTHSVGIVRDSLIQWIMNNNNFKEIRFSLPVIAETYDGVLNDINGHHVKKEHVWKALNDPNILKQCIPGCESFNKESNPVFNATATNQIGPMNATFSGTVTLSNIQENQSYTISGEGQSSVGFANGSANVTLVEDSGITTLSYFSISFFVMLEPKNPVPPVTKACILFF